MVQRDGWQLEARCDQEGGGAPRTHSLLLAFWANMGFSNRCLTLAAMIHLCKILKIPELVIFDGTSPFAPGYLSTAFEIPKKISWGKGHTTVRYIVDCEEIYEELMRAYENPDKASGVCTFVHPELVTVAIQHVKMKGNPENPVLQCAPIRQIFTRDVNISEALIHECARQIRGHELTLRSTGGPGHIRRVSLYLRNGDMTALIEKKGDKHGDEVSIATSMHELMGEVWSWIYENSTAGYKTLILASTDCGRVREVMRTAFAKQPSDLHPNSHKLAFFCTCRMKTVMGSDANISARCPECDRTFLTAHSHIEESIRDSTVAEWIADMYWLTKGSRLASPRYSSTPEFLKLLKGSRFEQAVITKL